MYPLSLWGPVGPGAENDRDDVIRVATSLLSLGHDQAGESADTGEWTASLENEMRAFQRAHGIAIDGVAVPGGETEQSLNDNLATQPSVATRSPPVPRRAIAARESPADSQSVLSERYGKTGRTLPYGNDVHERLFSPGFNAFAIAPANVEHASTRLADPGTGNTARADPVSGLLGNNPITGRPFRLQALGDNAASPYLSAERAPPTDNSDAIARLAKLALQQVQRATPRRSLTLDEQEQILTEYGFRYRPDPMGRIGLGDWLDASGRVLSEDEQAQILRRPYSADAIERPTESRGATAIAKSESFGRGRNGLVERLKEGGRSKEQIMNILKSGMGKDLLTAFERIDAAADAEGAVPAAVLKTELRRLGIDAPAEAAVIPVTDEKEPRGRRPESRRFNFGSDAEPAARAYRQIWDWFTRDIEPLADAKQSSLRPIDDTIRALEEERAKPGLSLLDRWMIDTNLAQLRVTRSKVNVAFPASPLDLAALGISAIGMVQVGNRAIPLFRQGNKVFDADDLAKGAWRQARPIENLDEYSAAEWRIYLEQKYGRENIRSTTIPGTDSQWWPLRGQEHRPTGIWYDGRGFPIFDPVAKFDTRLPDSVRWGMGDKAHKSAATRQLREAIERGQVRRSDFSPEQLDAIRRGEPTIPEHRWHHHQEYGRMQLVPQRIHENTPHIGGVGMRRGQ